ncbi:MAG: polymorphic toxin type 33 domain-containing protein [Cyanobacteriota bacterium]|nr:polymorphic toxin type 33 domain-containing protein [Cyanobacteriota bacterium]
MSCYEGEERSWREDRRLSVGEIKKLQDAGYDIHDLKRDCPAGVPARCDLFKDRNGNIYVKPKNGRGAGEPVDINIYEI